MLSKLSTGLQHIGIPTNVLDKTLDFYHSLGFVTAYETVTESANERVAFLGLGNLIIETYENRCACEEAGAIDHIALNVTDIEQTYCLIKEKNFKILHETIQFLPFWQYGVRFFTIEGPNREKVEFSQILKECGKYV